MMKIKKGYNLKIISVIIGVFFLFNATVYAYPFFKHTLRVPSIFQDEKRGRIKDTLTYFAGLKMIGDTSEVKEALGEFQRNGDGKLLVFKPVKGPVETAYIDWGALSGITPVERKELFNFLSSYGIGINILTEGGDPEIICDTLEKEGNLANIITVVNAMRAGAVFGSEEESAFYKSSGVRMVFNLKTKAAYLNKLAATLKPGYKALFLDDEARHFFIHTDKVITVGIVRNKATSLDYLISGATASYYIMDLNDSKAISQLLDFVAPLLLADSEKAREVRKNIVASLTEKTVVKVMDLALFVGKDGEFNLSGFNEGIEKLKQEAQVQNINFNKAVKIVFVGDGAFFDKAGIDTKSLTDAGLSVEIAQYENIAAKLSTYPSAEVTVVCYQKNRQDFGESQDNIRYIEVEENACPEGASVLLATFAANLPAYMLEQYYGSVLSYTTRSRTNL